MRNQGECTCLLSLIRLSLYPYRLSVSHVDTNLASIIRSEAQYPLILHRSIRITQLLPSYSNTTMSSQALYTPEIESTPSQASTSATASILPSAFDRMIGGSRPTAIGHMRDQCTRPVFSSCGLNTTPHASNITGESLAH